MAHWKLLLNLKLYVCYLGNERVTGSYVTTERDIENYIGFHLTNDCVIGSMWVLTMWLEFNVRTGYWKLLLSLKLYCGLSGKLLCHRKLIMNWKLLWKEILVLKWHCKLLLYFKFLWYIRVFGIRWWKIIWYCSHIIPSNTPTAGVSGSVFEHESLWASNRLLSTIVYSLLTGCWPHC